MDYSDCVQTIPGVGSFVGSLTTTSFRLVNGVIHAVGTIRGTFTPVTGPAQTITNQAISVPLTGLTGTCTILSLHTGAINLNLLGLNVSVAPIDLVITAQAGGGLLGSLLCAALCRGASPRCGWAAKWLGCPAEPDPVRTYCVAEFSFASSGGTQ